MEQREKGYNTTEDWEKSGIRTWKDYVWLYNNMIKHYTSPNPIEKILDIGCGDGKITADIAKFIQFFRLAQVPS